MSSITSLDAGRMGMHRRRKFVNALALTLSLGATRLAVDGKPVDVGSEPEYAALYRRFAGLLAARQSDADFTPFRHVVEALDKGSRLTVKPFSWTGN